MPMSPWPDKSCSLGLCISTFGTKYLVSRCSNGSKCCKPTCEHWTETSVEASGQGCVRSSIPGKTHLVMDKSGCKHIGQETLARIVEAIGPWTHRAVNTSGHGHIWPWTHRAVNTSGHGHIWPWTHRAVNTSGHGHI